MVFFLSIRQCRFCPEEWTKGRKGPGRKIRSSSRPPPEVCSFHQTLKKQNKAIRKKILMPRGLLRDLQVWFRGFRGRTSRGSLATPLLLQMGSQDRCAGLHAPPHERTWEKYSLHELPLKPKDLNQVEEKDREIPLYGHRHKKGRSNICSVNHCVLIWSEQS